MPTTSSIHSFLIFTKVFVSCKQFLYFSGDFQIISTFYTWPQFLMLANSIIFTSTKSPLTYSDKMLCFLGFFIGMKVVQCKSIEVK